MNVVVVGGGIGGPAVAQSLRRSGVPVAVFGREWTRPAPRPWERQPIGGPTHG